MFLKSISSVLLLRCWLTTRYRSVNSNQRSKSIGFHRRRAAVECVPCRAIFLVLGSIIHRRHRRRLQNHLRRTFLRHRPLPHRRRAPERLTDLQPAGMLRWLTLPHMISPGTPILPPSEWRSAVNICMVNYSKLLASVNLFEKLYLSLRVCIWSRPMSTPRLKCVSLVQLLFFVHFFPLSNKKKMRPRMSIKIFDDDVSVHFRGARKEKKQQTFRRALQLDGE